MLRPLLALLLLVGSLTVQAAQDSQRQRELQKSIGGVADPFRLIGLEAAGTEQA